MKHLGDITKIKGCNAPVVDCIIGGSPCQDLSVAGKRAGLAGERSGLYMEQIRIIKEMRYKDEQSGRTGESIRPRYMVWENVPGAFSSNGGKDFAAVIEEAIKVADPQAPSVPVPEKGWPTSGCFMGDHWSVAWRVLDAQFWGVPQRRRRIALVADFGGQSAPEILFVRKGVSRDLDESEPQRKATAGDVKNCSGADDRERRGETDSGGNRGFCSNLCGAGSGSTKWDDNQGTPRIGVVGFPLGFRPENVRCYDEVATTLCNGTRPGFTTGVIQPIAFDTYNMVAVGDKTVTLRAGAEYNYAPVFQPVSVENHPADSRVDIDDSGKVQTLTSRMGTGGGNVPMVMEPVIGIDQQGGKGGANYSVDVSPPILSDSHGTPHAVAYTLEPGIAAREGGHIYEGVSGTLRAKAGDNQMAVAHPVSCIASSATNAEITDGDISPCLRARAGTGGNNVPSIALKVHLIRYIVRRLTPLECERLQGYPDGWTDIGEWIDSKGKKHKEADSPRYKALGNSIALPPWKWVLKRLCGCYERDATMASLFDGIGGFPYLWEQLNGKGSCLWASEVEQFPIAVTKKRFGD